MIQFIFECIFQIFAELIVEYFFTKYKKWAWSLWAFSSVVGGFTLVHYTEAAWWQILAFSPIIGLFLSILLLLPVYLGIKLSTKTAKKKVHKG